MLRGQMAHDSTYGCISSSTGSCLGGLNNYGETVDQTVHLSMASPSMCLLPLYDCNKQLLPIHFLTEDEVLSPLSDLCRLCRCLCDRRYPRFRRSAARRCYAIGSTLP